MNRTGMCGGGGGGKQRKFRRSCPWSGWFIDDRGLE